MGKKPKSGKGKVKAQSRKLDKAELPPPPTDVENELGSAKLLPEPKHPGTTFKAIGQDGYDDGGVADLTLVIDLEDTVLRRKRGENNYFTALKADLLPRVTTGQLQGITRREQKIRLAKLLFDEDDKGDEDANPSEVYMEPIEDGVEDAAAVERLRAAKFALKLSSVLREPACASLSLSEISKRYLNSYGKEQAEAALRCADKAIEISSNGFYDSDSIAIEATEKPEIDPKYEKNATYPGLSHPQTLKLQAKRVATLCMRSACLHRGNALSALGRNEDARESYERVLPMLEDEVRCGRLDWERSSVYINIGNTFSRAGDFKSASKYYGISEKLGQDHLDIPDGNHVDGMGIVIASKRARAFALKKSGDEDGGKKEMKEVLEMQVKADKLRAEQNKKLEEEAKAAEAAQAEAEKAAGQ